MTTERLFDDDVDVTEAVIRVLEGAGIDMVFGIPGGYTVKFYDALYDHTSSVRAVLVREESLAGVMAEVYGRLTGKPAVVMGQGAFLLSNALMGTIEGHLASTPMLLLTDFTDGAPYSHHGPYQTGTGEWGAFDAKQSFAGVTKETMVAGDPAQAVQVTQLAIKHALTGEPGPVAVIYHSQALSGTVGPRTRPALYPTPRYLPVAAGPADEGAVRAAAQTLLDAERPVIIAGNGVRMSQAYGQLERLAVQIEAPVATTATGKGVLRETHELALGVIGNFGLPVANAVVGQADAVIAVGTKLGATDTANEHPALLDPRRQSFVQIDIEPRNASWTFPVDHPLIGDAGRVLEQLGEALTAAGGVSGSAEAERRAVLSEARLEHAGFDGPEAESDDAPLLPQRIIKDLHLAIEDDAIIACDAGENRIFMTHFFQTKAAGTLIQPASVGGMGYAIPAALAAKLVFPDRQAVAVCGDGGFAMALNGLMSAVENELAITVVVFNNNALGWVLNSQGERVIASEFEQFDHAKIAQAMGCDGVRVEDPAELRNALADALSSGRPTVVDVDTSRETTYREVTSPLAEAAEYAEIAE